LNLLTAALINNFGMENLLIRPTRNTPLIDFSINGQLVMTGSVYAENTDEFFQPVFKWIKNLKAEEMNFKFTLDYMNTSAAKKILVLLQTLELNHHFKILKVNWQYEKGDEDTLETGQFLDEFLNRTKFEFTEIEKASKKTSSK
jgi:hypothetical protein